MFDSIGWAEVLVIALAGLFILGPERLPGAAAWAGRAIRQAKEYVAGTQAQLRQEMGPEFHEFSKPLAELRRMRGRDPRKTALDALLRDTDTGSPPTPTRGPVPADPTG